MLGGSVLGSCVWLMRELLLVWKIELVLVLRRGREIEGIWFYIEGVVSSWWGGGVEEFVWYDVVW